MSVFTVAATIHRVIVNPTTVKNQPSISKCNLMLMSCYEREHETKLHLLHTWQQRQRHNKAKDTRYKMQDTRTSYNCTCKRYKDTRHSLLDINGQTRCLPLVVLRVALLGVRHWNWNGNRKKNNIKNWSRNQVKWAYKGGWVVKMHVDNFHCRRSVHRNLLHPFFRYQDG